MPSGPLATISLSEYRVIITHLEVLAVMAHEFLHRYALHFLDVYELDKTNLAK